ncbi:energy-coupling factor transporter ATPase [Microaerobacter geothermalis]|uniref:energy-coupling factor transporter ATPase n=1 Tax=Microaerobacter geothermalis TaxID=674972 RepID=UPI001F2E65E1|nr:energy-coupling factor transporter ATPase [Microaerobacter geothermalis]MCF6094829.1 energy-coupling factor transporter ATPase [Microaerobacter geothermalis]
MEIFIEGLSYWYKKGTPFEKKALNHITLHIPPGQFVAIIGHTGSGKSTLIQHINGLLMPTEGRIQVGDITVTPKEKKSLANLRKYVGLVFQYPEHQLFEETVEKDVSYGPRNLGIPDELIRVRVREALSMVGIKEEMYSRSPFSLSGGQMRRVAIAGILAMNPKVLILDEPTAGLDPQGKENILKLIYQYHQENGLTTLFVSHNMDEVAQYADWIVVMKEGSILLQGPPSKVFQQEKKIREAFLDQPKITKLIKQLNQKMDSQIPLSIVRKEDLIQELKKRFQEREIKP